MALRIGMARVAANAAERCGDVANAWLRDARSVVAIADGLGHGQEAAVAADAAMDYIGSHQDDDPVTLFRGMHEALAGTRGAAVGVCIIEPALGQLTYLAVGNTRAGIFGWRTTRLDSYPGIVGGSFRRLVPVVVPIRPGDQLVLWTDGVDERLTPNGAPDVATPELADHLLHRFLLGKDDAGVIVAQLDAS